MMEINRDYIVQAKNIIRSHKKAEAVIRTLEARRPTLLAQIAIFTNRGGNVLEYLPDPDKRLYEKYTEAKEHLDIYRVVMKERVSQRDCNIISDTFDNKMSIEEAAKKYGLSVRTIKRVRKKGIVAIAEELMLREAVKGGN